MFRASADKLLQDPVLQPFRGRVQLIFTSPPFPLNRKKKYGNLQGEAYIEWLASFSKTFSELLTADGSIVMELGNAWEPGRPVMSTLALKALIGFQEAGNLSLCQQFVCHNPARLPTPAQWVNVKRIRVKDSFTNVWWMSPSDHPKADNRRVLVPYGKDMQHLLASGKYNSGRRPSEHSIGEKSFLTDNGGAIPPNVLSFSNTNACEPYQDYCRDQDLPLHPARMAPGLAEFFIKFLTEPATWFLIHLPGVIRQELRLRL